MNITLSADKELVEKTRRYAKRHNTSLNNLIRTYLARVTGSGEADSAAEEFAELARSHPGKSPAGFRFDREEIHRRGE